MGTLPRHVAIIMDRNGEWAKRRSLARIKGHSAGVKTVKKVVEAAAKRKIQVLSLFAFSTENWLRPKDEVSFLMGLLEKYLKTEARELIDSGIKLAVSGRLDRIPASTRRAVEAVVDESKNNTGMLLNVALDYGGRDEIVSAAAKLAKAVSAGEIKPEDITEEYFDSLLYHPELGDVDLLIRTGSVERISNFMLWQIAYTELYFSPVLWPDFSESDLDKALDAFAHRQRRFGMTDEQVADNTKEA